MSSPLSQVGLNLLPITATFAAPFTAYGLLLSWRVTAERIRTEVFNGDTVPSTKEKGSKSRLPHLSRAYGNFIENVPLAFTLCALCELNGGDGKVLTSVMSTLLALRVAHADGGLNLDGKFGENGIGRPIGYFGSLAVLGGLAGYATYLVRGYWGL